MSTRNLLRWSGIYILTGDLKMNKKYSLAWKNNATHLTSSQLEEVPLDAQQGEIFAQTITRMGSHDVRPLILTDTTYLSTLKSTIFFNFTPDGI